MHLVIVFVFFFFYSDKYISHIQKFQERTELLKWCFPWNECVSVSVFSYLFIYSHCNWKKALGRDGAIVSMLRMQKRACTSVRQGESRGISVQL